SVTKKKAADYGHIKWIEDLVPRDFKRLRLQDIEDMLLLLIQGKLSNLTVEERFAFNVSLRMFTRSIVIQRRMEDRQLGVESYQNRLNLTKLDTLMRIDELYKFSNGTLNDVRNALDDHLKGIRMQYLPQAIWRKGDKDRAAAMIQSIDKEPINYDKHALWGVSHWGRKRQQFYGFAVNRESALDVYSKRRIIAVTNLKIVEWHSYKHLDWITCQPMNQEDYNSNSLGFDQPQPPQSPVIHQPPQELSIQEMEDLKQQYLDELKHLSNLEYHDEIKIAELTKNFNGMSIEIRKKEKLLQLEQWAYLSTYPSKRLTSLCYDDDDDEDYTSAITPNEPVLSTKEPDNSLSMGDEHLDTILATESDEVIKSSVENLIPIPSESEGIPEHMCDVPFHDNSLPLDISKDQYEDFSESNDEFSSIDDDSFSFDNIDYVEASPLYSELLSSEVMEIVIPKVGGIDDDILLTIKGDILRENLLNVNHLFAKIEASNDNPIPFYDLIISGTPQTLTPSGEIISDEDVLEKIISKPLFEEEIIPVKIDQHPDNAESDLIESLRTHDFSLPISSKIDSLLDEFAGELTLLKSIPPGIDEIDCDFEEDIRLMEKLLYDNSSPCPSEEFVSANSDAATESFSPSPILVKDSDSIIEEIDLFCTSDYPMPPDIEDKDYDSERDILIPKDLASNNSLSFAEKESFHFDIPPFSRPPTKQPDGDTGILNIKMMGDISDQKAFMHKLMITLASHQEKFPDLLCHRCGTVKKFNTHRSHLNICPMLSHGQNNPPWMFFCSIFIPLDSLNISGFMKILANGFIISNLRYLLCLTWESRERKARNGQNQNKPDKNENVEKPGSVEGQSQSRKQKKKKIQSLKGQICKSYKVVLLKEQREGLKLQFIQRCSQGVFLPKKQSCLTKGPHMQLQV
nr:hypothetical protein [Tanacetum cinerariifolium]